MGKDREENYQVWVASLKERGVIATLGVSCPNCYLTIPVTSKSYKDDCICGTQCTLEEVCRALGFPTEHFIEHEIHPEILQNTVKASMPVASRDLVG